MITVETFGENIGLYTFLIDFLSSEYQLIRYQLLSDNNFLRNVYSWISAHIRQIINGNEYSSLCVLIQQVHKYVPGITISIGICGMIFCDLIELSGFDWKFKRQLFTVPLFHVKYVRLDRLSCWSDKPNLKELRLFNLIFGHFHVFGNVSGDAQ